MTLHWHKIEAQRLAAGHREIVLTEIGLGAFRGPIAVCRCQDTAEPPLADWLDAVGSAPLRNRWSPIHNR